MKKSKSSLFPYLDSIFINPVFDGLFAARVIAVFFAPILDCDEVFNYWDPTHFLTHGFGLQTWEYSPEYAIRSWVYAGLHAVLIKIGAVIANFNSRIFPQIFTVSASANLFYFIRCTYAAASAGADMFLYHKIRKHLDDVIVRPKGKTPETSWIELFSRPSSYFYIFSIFSTGYFHSSIAYLPSSFAMICFTVSLGYLIEYATTADVNVRSRSAARGLSILAIGGIVGWPFALALAPYWALHVVFSSVSATLSCHLKYVQTTVFKILSIVLPILALMIAVDSYLYGKFSLVPLNIVLYNVLFADSESGPDIFGTEPWHFYLQNLALNFNIILPLAFITPVSLLLHRFTHSVQPGNIKPPLWHLIIAPFYIWFAIFSTQPHKEERFMYVAYASLCFNAAITASTLSFLVPKLLPNLLPRRVAQAAISISIVSIFTGLSLSRSAALGIYYAAPMKVFNHVSLLTEETTGIPANSTYNVCIGREWYRFPSSFFLPDNARLQFISSGFNGLLPGQFLEDEKNRFSGIWTPPQGMNNKNLADPGKLVSLDSCMYVIDSGFEVNEEVGEVDFKRESEKLNGEYESVYCSKLLDTGGSKGLARLLYIPQFSGRIPSLVSDQIYKVTGSKLEWTDFCLYKKKQQIPEAIEEVEEDWEELESDN